MTTDALLQSAERLTSETAADVFLRHQVSGTKSFFRQDIDVHRLTYRTHDTDGSPVTASGAVLVPRRLREEPLPTLCYLRGTIIPGHWERRAPSYYDLENNQSIYENYEMSFLAAGFASAGYFTVAPDLIGYGADRDREHPYMHAPSLAWAASDMLSAAREFARREGIPLTDGAFIAGWSEGGLAGMALHHLLENEQGDATPVRATSLLAGCYALSAMVDWFCCLDEPYPEQHIYCWVLRSMSRIYGLEPGFAGMVRPEYIEPLTRDVLAALPDNPRDILVPRFRAEMLEREDAPLRRALRESDRYDWRPRAPVFLHHGSHDDIVPYFNAQMALEAIRKRGGRVALLPSLGQDHYQPVNAYLVRTLEDFAAVQV